jgi:hypothetical protein
LELPDDPEGWACPKCKAVHGPKAVIMIDPDEFQGGHGSKVCHSICGECGFRGRTTEFRISVQKRD